MRFVDQRLRNFLMGEKLSRELNIWQRVWSWCVKSELLVLKLALNILHFYFGFYVVLHYIGWLLLRLVEYLLGGGCCVVANVLRVCCKWCALYGDNATALLPINNRNQCTTQRNGGWWKIVLNALTTYKAWTYTQQQVERAKYCTNIKCTIRNKIN